MLNAKQLGSIKQMVLRVQARDIVRAVTDIIDSIHKGTIPGTITLMGRMSVDNLRQCPRWSANPRVLDMITSHVVIAVVIHALDTISQGDELTPEQLSDLLEATAPARQKALLQLLPH